jgi:hypothetical protein
MRKTHRLRSKSDRARVNAFLPMECPIFSKSPLLVFRLQHSMKTSKYYLAVSSELSTPTPAVPVSCVARNAVAKKVKFCTLAPGRLPSDVHVATAVKREREREEPFVADLVILQTESSSIK